MPRAKAEELRSKKCRPCEGGMEAICRRDAETQAAQLDGWKVVADGTALRREWVALDFAAAMEFLDRVARLAEDEDHHPDLHLTGYRNVAVELSTHAIGGLSENDFILAAKINSLPIRMKKS